MKNLKKRIRLIICAAMVFAAVMMLPVFATETKAQTPKQAAKQVMNAIKKCNDKKLGGYINLESGGLYSTLNQQYPSVYNYFKKRNNKIKFTIGKVKTSGNKADVKVKVKYVDSKDFVDKVVDEYGNFITDMFTNRTAVSDSKTAVEGIFNKAAASAKDTIKSTTITLHFVKAGNSWLLTNETANDDKFKSVIFCNFLSYENRIKTGMISKMESLIPYIAQQSGVSEAQVKALVDQYKAQYGL